MEIESMAANDRRFEWRGGNEGPASQPPARFPGRRVGSGQAAAGRLTAP
jgi:hypothetical protein